MKTLFRIHGDNIVECERILNYLFADVKLITVERGFSSLSCMFLDVSFEFKSQRHNWKIELFPGFRRWKSNIFDALLENGSFLDEAPDAIITRIDSHEKEVILFAVEFCSALQAGNQAWQRSGRAYSTGRASCPYIYIVDFVKYELNTKTRERRALRFPNAAIPYSYISFTKYTGTLVVQAYVKSEEFQPTFDTRLKDFDSDIFSNIALSEYMLLKMLGKDTTAVEDTLLNKNALMVEWLSKNTNKNHAFNKDDWQIIYDTDATTITHSLDTRRFKFTKKIAEKSIVGKSRKFLKVVKEYCVGMASKDLPFGIIPAETREAFASDISVLYSIDDESFNKISQKTRPLIVCIVKGFKPRGDDNRPDRGVLPLIAMLSSETAEILTYLYGPLIKNNYKSLCKNPAELAQRSGFWRVFMSLSNYFVLDVPLLPASYGSVEKIIDNTEIKHTYISQRATTDFSRDAVSVEPNSYQEDDVDMMLHVLFKYFVNNCFEGMCNPPGGDWSGLSIVYDDLEYRWLSLPRVSVNCKRPDHVVELFGLGKKPILLVTESKGSKTDLENEVGLQLKGYIDFLLSHTASVVRSKTTDWAIAKAKISGDAFDIITASAYLSNELAVPSEIFARCKCDMIFVLHPDTINIRWILRIFANSKIAEVVREHVARCLEAIPDSIIKLVM